MRRAAAAALAPLLIVAATSAAAIRNDIEPWAGPGYRSVDESYLRPVLPGVTFTPLLTVGDTLVPPDPEHEGFVFYPRPEGTGSQRVRDGLAEIYVAHGLEWDDGLGGGRVSRILVDPRSSRILAADWIVDGIEQFEHLGAATLAGPHEGMLSPRLLVNETSIRGPNRGLVASVDPRSGAVTGLPWLGRFRHAQTILLPVSGGQMVTILTEDALPPGLSRLYMYLSNGDIDLLNGRGQLFVLQADPPPGRGDTGLSSMAKKVRPLAGRFVPLRGVTVNGDETQPAAIAVAAELARGLRFVRLGGVVADHRVSNAFFVADLGDDDATDPVSGRPIAGAGRIYRIELDPFDPTIVRDIRVVLDGDEGDDLYRPRHIAADDFGVLIQEAPGRRGIHPARILRYEFRSQRLEPIAVCVERDPQGRLLPEGTGGVWESSGITDASDAFGEGAWLVTVEAPTVRDPFFRGRAGGGQLLLMRTPVWGRAEPKETDAPEGDLREEPSGP